MIFFMLKPRNCCRLVARWHMTDSNFSYDGARFPANLLRVRIYDCSKIQ
jgi:hypothetical protein